MADSTEKLNIPPAPEIPKIKLDYHFGSEKPKRPEDYKLGDNLVDYFPITDSDSLPPLPATIFEGLDKVLEARKETHLAKIAFMDAVIECHKSLFDVRIARARYIVAEAQGEAMRERRLKLKASIAVSQPHSSGESTPDPSKSESDVRRDRLAGVDVSKLPAGFGKRRASGAGAAAKRPKTPTEGAPEVQEATPAATP